MNMELMRQWLRAERKAPALRDPDKLARAELRSGTTDALHIGMVKVVHG